MSLLFKSTARVFSILTDPLLKMNPITTEVIVDIIPETKPVKIVEPLIAKKVAEPILTEKVIRKVHNVTTAPKYVKKGINPFSLKAALNDNKVTAHREIASPTNTFKKINFKTFTRFHLKTCI